MNAWFLDSELSTCFLLTSIGGRPVEVPYIGVGQFAAVFILFIFLF